MAADEHMTLPEVLREAKERLRSLQARLASDERAALALTAVLTEVFELPSVGEAMLTTQAEKTDQATWELRISPGKRLFELVVALRALDRFTELTG